MADETILDGNARDEQQRGTAPPTFVDGAGAPPDGGYQPLPPTLVAEGYRAVRELGSGAEARVWLCTAGSGRGVAVKVYFHEPAYAFAFESDDYRRHFARDWTVEVLSRGCDRVAGSDLHYEVMEYCAGGTLEELAATSGRSDEFATKVVRRLTACLKALQGEDHRVVHGDLKPRNVLVRNAERTELVLADFGLTVNLQERSVMSNFGKGTTAYNAPELLRYKAAPADWWSLGMVMYTLLVGRGYYQLGDDRWLNQAAIEDDLISRDVSLDELDRLDMPEVRRGRWKLLLAGLLTRDREHRWGATEVESWLAGGNPAVHRQLDVSRDAPGTAKRRGVEPFAFAGVGEFSTPRELGEAMAARPGDAARMLGGKGTARLVDWLTDEVRTGDDYSELGRHSWDPDAKRTYFVARMAPAAPLTFREHAIGTPADLRRLVGASDGAVIDALFTAELLGSLADDGPRKGYRMIEANWQDLVARAVDAARQRGITMSEQMRAQVRRHALLLTASDATVADGYVREVQGRVTSAAMAVANEVDWFKRLRTDALG